jgi:DNA-binding NtrC family response regulator
MTLAADAVEALRDYEWPGNVRELKAVIEKAAEVCNGSLVHAEHLSIQLREVRPMLTHAGAFDISVPGDGRSLKDIEAEAIQQTLVLTDGNQTAAAQILEISRPTLTRKIREYGLSAYAQTSGPTHAVRQNGVMRSSV